MGPEKLAAYNSEPMPVEEDRRRLQARAPRSMM